MRPKLISGGDTPRGLAGGAGMEGPAIRVKEARMIDEKRWRLVHEIARRADELQDGSSAPVPARIALRRAEVASYQDPLSKGMGASRTSAMVRRCALDCAAWALLAVEALEVPR